jgi:Transposase DDE domain group 1
LTQALVAHFVASYPEPPAAIVLDLDHPDDPTHGQQEFACYNHYYKTYCYLPLLIFAGLSGALVTACRRPGTRPTGAENALSLVRLLACLRRHGPRTHIRVRGDSHFATPEVLEVLAHRHVIDVVFGLAGNPVLLRHAAPVMQEAWRLHQQRTALAQAHHARPPDSSRL